MDDGVLENWFTYHKPQDDQPQRYENIRTAALIFARVVNASCPDSADKTVAMRKIREAVMVANASIACGGK